MKILVTGGAGYIGSHTLVELIQDGVEVISIDNFDNSTARSFDLVEKITGKRVVNHQINLCDQLAVNAFFEKEKGIDGIIHFAAHKAVGESVDNPLKYYKNNLETLTNILTACKLYNIHSFLFSSSCSVYGNADELPVSEKTPLKRAESPYAHTKQIGEDILQASVIDCKLNAIALRYFNPVGAHISGFLGENPINKPNNLVPVICNFAAGKMDSLSVFGTDYDTRDGSCIRDFIHVTDIAKAHVLAIKFLIHKKSENSYDTVNLGTGNGVSVLEAIQSFEKVTGIKLNYIKAGRREGDVINIYSDSSKAKQLLGWVPQYGIDDMMQSSWKWQLFLEESAK